MQDPIIKGVIFDLDGTLIDSQLDFEAMRADMGIAPGAEILEAIANETDQAKQLHMQRVVDEHEIRGALNATVLPGVHDLFTWLKKENILRAIFTRNSRSTTELALKKFQLEVDIIVARDDAPPKPDPSGLKHILEHWNLEPHEAMYVGDFDIDLQAGAGASVMTVLYAGLPLTFEHNHSHVITHWDDLKKFI